jgi:hypothetical protein
MNYTFTLESLHRSTHVPAIKGLGQSVRGTILSRLNAQVRDAQRRAGTLEGFVEGEAEAHEADFSQAMRAVQGFSPAMTDRALMELYLACEFELQTLAESKFDSLGSIEDFIKWQLGRGFDPKSLFIKGQAAQLMEEFDIDEAHAMEKLAKRHEKRLDGLKARSADILEQWEILHDESTERDIEDAMDQLAAPDFTMALKKMAAGIANEAKRLRALDRKYDWDEMLVQAKLLEAELPKIDKAIRALSRKGADSTGEQLQAQAGKEMPPTTPVPAATDGPIAEAAALKKQLADALETLAAREAEVLELRAKDDDPLRSPELTPADMGMDDAAAVGATPSVMKAAFQKAGVEPK